MYYKQLDWFDNQLTNTILLLSSDVSLGKLALKEWDFSSHVDANDEAQMDDVHWSDLDYQCICGHHPLRYLYYFVNNVNGNEILLGSECFSIFSRVDEYKALQKFLEGKTKRLKRVGVWYVWEKGIINDSEFQFYRSMTKRRVFSEEEEDKVNWIEGKIKRVFLI